MVRWIALILLGSGLISAVCRALGRYITDVTIYTKRKPLPASLALTPADWAEIGRAALYAFISGLFVIPALASLIELLHDVCAWVWTGKWR